MTARATIDALLGCLGQINYNCLGGFHIRRRVDTIDTVDTLFSKIKVFQEVFKENSRKLSKTGIYGIYGISYLPFR